MHPVFLRDLEAAGVAAADRRRVRFAIEPRWCALGENRLGYPGLLRLMECVRELHWRLDVLPRYPELDSITKALQVEFLRPVTGGSEVTGEYEISQVDGRSYVLEIALRDGAEGEQLARGRLTSVFYDEALGRSVEPPASLVTALRSAVPE
jgi:acyl-CoA thioesterase FadM